jgi:glycosyltransferase involved in cell wall biosynthesis
MERPLISFILVCYKQEQFVREAVAGAFAQTYAPLEIILSDDCSPDGTFAVMEEMAKAYRGPHRVVLNRNPKNLGLVGHINRAVEMATGEFIVPGAGDDISLPHRTETVVRLWQESGGRAKSIYSDVVGLQQDEARTYHFTARPEQNTLEHQLRTGNCNVLGASQCYHRSLFDFFGPLPPTLFEEDHVLPFRAALLGEVVYCPEVLLKYRVHVGNVSQSGERRATHAAERAALAKLLARNKLPWLTAFCDDLATAHRKGALTDAQYAEHRAQVENCIKLDRASLAWLTGKLGQRVRAAWTLYRHDGPEPKMSSSALYLLAVGVWPGLGEVWERIKARQRK